MNPDSIFQPLDMLSPWTSVLKMLRMGELIPKGFYSLSLYVAYVPLGRTVQRALAHSSSGNGQVTSAAHATLGYE